MKAVEFLKKIECKVTRQEIERLERNIRVIEKGGLHSLNRRLFEGGRNVWDTFFEHNLAAQLLLSHEGALVIRYEPEEIVPPPDFRIVVEGITYWIQVKQLADLERENRKSSIVEEVKRRVRDIKVGLFFELKLVDGFNNEDIDALVTFLVAQASGYKEDEECYFEINGEPKASIKFWCPRKPLSSLTCGVSGDMKMVETTGLAVGQIRGSFRKAARVFNWNIDGNNINLIAVNVDRYCDIDICDALFGEEYDFSYGEKMSWARKEGGLFSSPDYKDKLVGVLAFRGQERCLVDEYFGMLYANGNFNDRIEDIRKVVSFEKCVRFNMRPPMGQGYFERLIP